MPLSQYLLLALLATGGIAPTTATAAGSRMIGADALTQPNGGTMSGIYVGQKKPRKEEFTRHKKITKTRRHPKGRHHSKTVLETPKKDG